MSCVWVVVIKDVVGQISHVSNLYSSKIKCVRFIEEWSNDLDFINDVMIENSDCISGGFHGTIKDVENDTIAYHFEINKYKIL